MIAELPQPLLILGNPPWVTNSALGVLSSTNLPVKTNAQGLRGIDAITGKSNFDISEWMLLRAFQWLNGRRGALAMLCKSSVARKALRQAWKGQLQISSAKVFQIDAKAEFNASVDACLLVVTFRPRAANETCEFYASLDDCQPTHVFGYCEDTLVSDVQEYQKHLQFRTSEGLKWRSGVKHDCARVMQLRKVNGKLVNGFEEVVDLEPEYLYPLLKSSSLANGRTLDPNMWVIVPQQYVGEDTSRIRHTAPKTWEYLNAHAEYLEKRSSSIYRGKPRFSVFGVGDYTFRPWKVAISGLYKHFRFRAVGPFAGKPIVFDDTCYFLPCESRKSAELICQTLNSSPARDFLSSLVFWDDKRPVTSQLLARLDVPAVARSLGLPSDFPELGPIDSNKETQHVLFG